MVSCKMAEISDELAVALCLGTADADVVFVSVQFIFLLRPLSGAGFLTDEEFKVFAEIRNPGGCKCVNPADDGLTDEVA